MAWSDAARAAALEARRHAHAARVGLAFEAKRRPGLAKALGTIHSMTLRYGIQAANRYNPYGRNLDYFREEAAQSTRARNVYRARLKAALKAR